MRIDDAKLKDILLRENYVTEEDVKKAEQFAKQHRSSIIEYFTTQGLITANLLGQAIAESFKVSYADLGANPPSREQILKIPESFARQFRAVLFAQKKTGLTVTTDNPKEKDLATALKKIFPAQKKITITYSLPEEIDAALVNYQKSLETRFSKIIREQKRVAPEILEEIFADAFVYHASDIHFEPQPKDVLVRFRIDGVLHEAGRVPKEHYENILNRIKVVSSLRIDEHFAAQDGSLRYQREGLAIDMRTSIVPTIEGEKVVLRVLTAYVEGLTLDLLGFTGKHQEIITAAARKPFGMVLVTGPTGSGKTTTLYALLGLLNQPEVNITTIEDPVEYKVENVNQIQVNPLTNLTFAKGLRSIVRQDPDIILVGEIRDNETAEIAVNAALTGHLLLSTFHANDAATAIPRLLDMQIEPFLLASTLEVIAAQRLVRKICEHCRRSVTMSSKDISKQRAGLEPFFGEKNITLYQGKGCEGCGHSGFKGRTAIFEFIRVTPEMQNLILQNPSTQAIWQLARTQGSRSLFEDGIEKVKNGITTLEELLRVAEPPQKSE